LLRRIIADGKFAILAIGKEVSPEVIHTAEVLDVHQFSVKIGIYIIAIAL
jgi:hypothetical protein